MELKTIVHNSIDLVCRILVKIESPKDNCFQCCNHCVSPTDDRWNPLKVTCGILIVAVITAFIVMLWWLPGNGKEWLIGLITTLCFCILLVLVDEQE